MIRPSFTPESIKKIFTTMVFAFHFIGYNANTLYSQSISPMIGDAIWESWDPNRYHKKDSLEIDSTLRVFDYQRMLDEFILDNNTSLADSIAIIKASDPKLYDSCLRITVENCFQSALYILLCNSSNDQRDKEKLEHLLKQIRHYSDYFTFDSANGETHRILDIYFQKLFPDEKKMKLGIYYEIKMQPSYPYPVMTDITLEEIQHVFDTQKELLKPEILAKLKNSFLTLWFTLEDETILSFIDEHFQTLKDEYYNLKIKDEIERIINESITYIALEIWFPEALDMDLDLLEQNISTSNIDQFYSKTTQDLFGYLRDRKDATFPVADFVNKSKRDYFRIVYRYYYAKKLNYEIHNNHISNEWEHFIQKFKQYAESQSIGRGKDEDIIRENHVREQNINKAIQFTLHLLYEKQEKGWWDITNLTNSDQIIDFIYDAFIAYNGNDMAKYQEFYDKYIESNSHSENRKSHPESLKSEIKWQIQLERHDIIRYIQEKNLFPEIENPHEDK